MDKQKQTQTEELIGIIQGAVVGCATHWASLIAEEVLKYYQPKIPENVVVVSRAEYNDLKGLEKHFDDYLIKEIVETRKETAEKFAKRLKEEIADFD